MYKNIFAKGFLLFLVVAVLYLCYQIFAPFMDEILISAVLVSIFYTPYERLTKFLRGRNHIAALIMCILIALVVILPFTNFIVYAAQRSVVGYNQALSFADKFDFNGISNNRFMERANMLGLSKDTIKNVLLDVGSKMNSWLVDGAANLIKGTTSFVISLVLILLTMYFFFVDGSDMLKKLMQWSPLPNKYDKRLFDKFRAVGFSTIISTFATAFAQGIVGAIGFYIIGLPAFFTGIAIAFFSIIPYFGTTLIWLPTAIYLLVIGEVWQGIFLIIWGGAVISTIDNFIRAYIIKGKAQVHPIFVIFSILGGITFFGFWGIVFGPLAVSLAITILHIYELEYESVLEK